VAPPGTKEASRSAAPFTVAIEEHYCDLEIAERSDPTGQSRASQFRGLLQHLGEGRLQEMDAAGIDMQVLSHVSPGVQRFDPETAVTLARRANDRLHAAIKINPKRFAAFAALPTPDPKKAADELERAVTTLGFKGAMVDGLTGGRFIDEADFWPIFARAQALDVPIYLHPAAPHPMVVDAYYQTYAERYPALLGAAWGFTAEAATQAIRMVLSGIFDAYPGLKIILGHLGEGLPYLLWRIDHALSRPGNLATSFRDTFCEHFYITTSGNFSNPALLCCLMEIGVDNMLFAVDWPFASSLAGTNWARDWPLCPTDRAKILGNNARRLLRL
jgi:predicted TIM-barrel fold metal-dependent hydrolase